MKHRIFTTSVFCLLMFVLIAGCQKDKGLSKIIGPDNEVMPPTLTIEKGGPLGVQVNFFNPEEEFLSDMMIFRVLHPFQTERSFGCDIEVVNPVPDSVYTRPSADGVTLDTTTLYYSTVDLNRIALAGLEMESLECSGESMSRNNSGPSIITFNNYCYHFPPSIENEAFDIFYNSEKISLTISGSPAIQNVEAELNLPKWNFITNIQSEQVINANEDLIIDLEFPADYLVIWAVEVESNQYGGHSVNGTGSIVITPSFATREFVIPSEEIIQMMEDNPTANAYMIGWLDRAKVEELQLYDYDGNPYQILPVNCWDEYHLVVYFTSESI